MGANNFGFYFFIVTLITTLAIFSKNGLDLLVIRFIPKYIVENKGLYVYASSPITER